MQDDPLPSAPAMHVGADPYWRQVLRDALLNADSAAYRRTLRVVLCLIMVSLGLVAVESADVPLTERYRIALDVLEAGVAVAFTVEFLANAAVAKSWWRYAFGWVGLIDLLAILPFYLGLFSVGVAAVGGLTVLRQVRVLRILRVLKLGKLTVSSQSAAQQDDLWLPTAIFVSMAASGWVVDNLYRSAGMESLGQARQATWVAFQCATWLSGAYAFNRATHVVLWEGLFGRRLRVPVPRLIRDVQNTLVYAVAVSGIIGLVFHQSLTGVWTAAGALSVVIGLALRNIILDLFVGIALNVERSFKIGDWVEVQHKSIIGKVVEINWRTTHLLTDEGNLIIVPNSRIGEMVLVNYSAPEPHSEQQFPITLDYTVPPERVVAAVLDGVMAAVGQDGVLADPAPDARVRAFTPLGVEYIVQYHVDFGRWYVSRARNTVLKSVLEHLQKAGIAFAYSRQDVYYAPLPGPAAPPMDDVEPDRDLRPDLLEAADRVLAKFGRRAGDSPVHANKPRVSVKPAALTH